MLLLLAADSSSELAFLPMLFPTKTKLFALGVWADGNHCLAAKDRKGFGGEAPPACSPGKPGGQGALGRVGGPNLCLTIPGDAYTLFVRAFFHGHQETYLGPP